MIEVKKLPKFLKKYVSTSEKELRRRDTAIEPIVVKGLYPNIEELVCAVCGNNVCYDDNFCSECGQRLDWSE